MGYLTSSSPSLSPIQTDRPNIIIAGQSQALGHGDDFYADPDKNISAPFGAVLLNSMLGADAVTPIVWTAIATGPLQPYASPGTPNMGYELSFGRALYDAGLAPWYSKFAVNSAGLAAHFLPLVNYPTSPSGDNLFGQLCLYFDARIAETGRPVDLFIWDQGGTDAIDSGPAHAYQANLGIFLAALRARYGDFVCMILQLNETIPLTTCPYREIVRVGQAAYVKSDPLSILVNTDAVSAGGPYVDSIVHFDANACISIGWIMAQAAIPLFAGTTTTTPTYIGAAPAAFGAGALSPVWGGEDGYEVGDLGILAISGGFNNVTASLTTANGFAQIGTADSVYTTLHQRLTLYWCIATSQDMPSPVVAAGNSYQTAKIFIFRGASRSAPIDSVGFGVNNAYTYGKTLPAVTTLSDRCLISMFSAEYCAAQADPLTAPSSTVDFPSISIDNQSGLNLGGGNFQIFNLITAEKRRMGLFSAVTANTEFPNINANITIALRPQ